MDALVRHFEQKQSKTEENHKNILLVEKRHSRLKVALTAVLSLNLMMLCGFVTLLMLLARE